MGWVATSNVSDRCAYADVLKHSADPSAQGRGVEAALLDVLIASTKAAGLWYMQSGVLPQNRTLCVPTRP